ncbi:MAG: GGDEF domain-containing protein, partial [Betaproteobacteria bacterium]|nr:GGDEF domain-containing protein [Betaproteobacteria bacterium]
RMRESNARLYDLAMHDPLTGAFNARAYYQIGDQLIMAARRTESPYSVLFVDLDHFKSVNDTYGHAAGDTVLKACATCIAGNIRASDIIGRVGGEEFSLFLPATDIEAALQVAEKIRLAIETLEIPIAPERNLRISASIGVARSQQHDQTLQDIQRQADTAMYQAKSAGRNRVSCFTAASSAASAAPAVNPSPAEAVSPLPSGN